jgi:asparagine synthase (glutamine-hydrolysing)
MCGVAGFTNPTPGAHRILAEMNAALGHRGPDGTGVFVDDGIALGHTRLAIIDVSGGAQPRVDQASGDALVFNGEIYGYRALAAELRGCGVRCATSIRGVVSDDPPRRGAARRSAHR